MAAAQASGLGLFFSGNVMALIGFTETRVKVFEKNIVGKGGKVYQVATGALAKFLKKKPLPQNLTHVLVGDDRDLSRVLKDLDVPFLPPGVQVLRAEWVSACMKDNGLATIEPYVVTLQATSVKLAAEASSGYACGGEGEGPSKKPRLDGPAMSLSDIAKKAAELGKLWTEVKLPGDSGPPMTHCMRHPDSVPPTLPCRVAAFDFDDTLVKPQGKAKWPKDADDWRWIHVNVRARMKEMHEKGYKVVIMSNQGTPNPERLVWLKRRISNVIANLTVPVDAYVSNGYDLYRKPNPGMWWLMEDSLGGPVDLAGSLYVGDAAGRQGDHSGGDVKLARNVGVRFHTPEEFFEGSTRRSDLGETWLANIGPHPLEAIGATDAASTAPPAPVEPPTVQEAVVLVGPPGVGKSTYCQVNLPHHVRVNQDTLKRLEKCRDASRQALGAGRSVVIDATNIKVQLRREWIESFRSSVPAGKPMRLRCIHFDIPTPVAVHLDAFRKLNPDGEDRRSVSSFVIERMARELEPPQASEGWDVIERVTSITVLPFRSDRSRQLFNMFLSVDKPMNR